jgi:hypothetical protein
MTLVSSGVLRLSSTSEGTNRSIQYEVEASTTTPYLFSTSVTHSSPSIGSLPKRFTDFYGHAQVTVLGRLYGKNDTGDVDDYYVVTETDNNEFAVPDDNTEYLLDTVVQNQNVKFTDDIAADFTGSEGYTMAVYRRTKLTSDSWSFVTSFSSYASESYSCDFLSYDYLFEIY